MKAIETQYNGYRFRSRIEARWAVFFDTAGIKYEYEKDGYVLENGAWYLPDFWLPEKQWFVEIKGVAQPEIIEDEWREECWLCHYLAEGTDCRVLLLEGSIPNPLYCPDDRPSCTIHESIWLDRNFRCSAFVPGRRYGNGWKPEETGWRRTPGFRPPINITPFMTLERDYTFLANKNALLTARLARFEHGETPSTQQP